MAAPRMDAPYAPIEEVQTRVDSAPGWDELYRVAPADEAAAITTLVDRSQPPPALGIAVGGKLFFSLDGGPGELKEATFSIKRKGKAVDYDNNCKSTPQSGDVLETVYASEDKTAEVTTRTVVKSHYAFGIVGELAMEPIRLDLKKPEHCAAVAESRILSTGTLTYRKNGRVSFRESILLQTIAAP